MMSGSNVNCVELPLSSRFATQSETSGSHVSAICRLYVFADPVSSRSSTVGVIIRPAHHPSTAPTAAMHTNVSCPSQCCATCTNTAARGHTPTHPPGAAAASDTQAKTAVTNTIQPAGAAMVLCLARVGPALCSWLQRLFAAAGGDVLRLLEARVTRPFTHAISTHNYTQEAASRTTAAALVGGSGWTFASQNRR